MKSQIQHTIFTCIVKLILLFSASCEHKELCYGHSHKQPVYLIFNWQNISNIPSAMRVCFYPINNRHRTEPYIFDISRVSASENTKIFIEEGKYKVVSFNIDTENILYRQESSFSEFEVYTQRRKLLLNSQEHNRKMNIKKDSLIDTPDWMCRAFLEKVHIKKEEKNATKIILTPRPAVAKLSYEIRGIKNLGKVKSVIGTFSGVVGSLFMGTGLFPSSPSTVYFNGEIDNGKVNGSFLVFGLHSKAFKSEDNVLTFYFRTDAGISSVSFNVGDLIVIEEGEKQYTVKINLIIEKEIELLFPILPAGGGLIVGAEEWEADYIDINM